MTLSSFSLSLQKNYSPGPGAYNSEIVGTLGKNDSKKISIRNRFPEKKSENSEIDFPPMTSSLSKKSFSIGNRVKSPRQNEIPGPSYLPVTDFELTSRKKKKGKKIENINNSKKIIKKDESPGPAQYFPQELSKTMIPTQGPRSPITLDFIPESPGPAAYLVPSTFSKDSPKFTIRPKTSINSLPKSDPEIYPYENHTITKESPKWTIPKSKIITKSYDTIPGPGSYSPERPQSSKIGPIIHSKVISKEKEILDIPLNDVRSFPNLKKISIGSKIESELWNVDKSIPGPEYILNSYLSNRSCSIHPKIELKTIQTTPGPSDYEPQFPLSKSCCAFTVKGPMIRDDWLPKDKSIPGPGQYNIEIKNELPKWTLGHKSIFKNSKNKTIV